MYYNPYNLRNGYRFNSGNKSTKYVQVLNILLYANVFSVKKSIKKSDVHRMMGWRPDHGNHSAMWAELNRIGYAQYRTTDQSWVITRSGIDYLLDNKLAIDYNEIRDILYNVDHFKKVLSIA